MSAARWCLYQRLGARTRGRERPGLTANELVEASEDALLPIDGDGAECIRAEEPGQPMLGVVRERDAAVSEPGLDASRRAEQRGGDKSWSGGGGGGTSSSSSSSGAHERGRRLAQHGLLSRLDCESWLRRRLLACVRCKERAGCSAELRVEPSLRPHAAAATRSGASTPLYTALPCSTYNSGLCCRLAPPYCRACIVTIDGRALALTLSAPPRRAAPPPPSAHPSQSPGKACPDQHGAHSLLPRQPPNHHKALTWDPLDFRPTHPRPSLIHQKPGFRTTGRLILVAV